MSVQLGHRSEPLSEALFDRVLMALSGSAYKAMLTAADGTYQETALSQDFQASSLRETHCILHAEQFGPEVLVATLPSEFANRTLSRVNLYWSPRGKGVPTHYDIKDILILQLAGAKQWCVSNCPATDAPTHNVVANPEEIALEDPCKVTANLHQGDWLYLPRAYWHRTQALSSSLSLTYAFD